jgi:two-component system sensor histidine kinase SenX3
LVAAVVLALLAGGVIGALVATLAVRRLSAPSAVERTPSKAPGPLPPRWSDVVDRLSLGVVVAGPGGELRYRNRAAHALDGTHMGVLVDDAIERMLARARAGEESRQALELYGPPRVAVVVRASPLDTGGAVATIEDVSERRRVDAVRTDFVANISHELRTPVGALAVLAETLADEDDVGVIHRIAARMVDEAHRVSRTIDDLLELSRIELGEEPVRDMVDVLDVVDAAVERTRALAETRRTRIEVLERESGTRVLGDRRQLVSALGNLVENAVKYSEPGSSVQVRVHVEGEWVELMVADHGIGIPAQHHDRIFERFYRVDKGRSRDTGGTGLGLAIVRHVATNHHGEVLVSSQEGEGSTFVLRIPLVTVDAGAQQEAVNP